MQKEEGRKLEKIVSLTMVYLPFLSCITDYFDHFLIRRLREEMTVLMLLANFIRYKTEKSIEY